MRAVARESTALISYGMQSALPLNRFLLERHVQLIECSAKTRPFGIKKRYQKNL